MKSPRNHSHHYLLGLPGYRNALQAQPEGSDAASYQLTFSYGVVEYDVQKHASIEQLLEEGDRLMYQDKKR